MYYPNFLNKSFQNGYIEYSKNKAKKKTKNYQLS